MKRKGCLDEMIQYDNPVKIEFGAGSLKFLPRFLKGRKALLVTSSGFVNRGLVKHLLNTNPSIINIISNIQPNPTLKQVLMFREQLNYDEFEVIIALGGGSVIDIAKAFSVFNETKQIDIKKVILEGFEGLEFQTKPIIAIPTTAGTGSEVTSWGTIWDDVNKKKYSIAHSNLYCESAILDSELHVTIPKELTIQTGLDALSHSLEAIWNKNANPISELYAVSAAKMILENLPKLIKDLTNIELREKMLLASYKSGLAFSNTQTAIAHAMSYYMTLYKGIPHGIAASITLPAIFEAALLKDGVKNSLYSIFPESANPVQELIALYKELNISLDLESYKITDEILKEIEASLESTTRIANSIVQFSDIDFENWMGKR